MRKVHPEIVEQAGEIAGPAHGHGRCGHAVFEHHVPTDEPRREFAKRGIRIRIRTAGHRNQRREFRVAQRGETASDCREDKSKQHGRAGVLGGGLSRDHENAAADHGADADRRETDRTERALQARAVAGVGVVGEVCFLGEQLAEIHGEVLYGCCRSKNKAGVGAPAFMLCRDGIRSVAAHRSVREMAALISVKRVQHQADRGPDDEYDFRRHAQVDE